MRLPWQSPRWSWPEFVFGAALGLLAASLLWFLLRVALVVLLLGFVVASACAILGGLGKLPSFRRPR